MSFRINVLVDTQHNQPLLAMSEIAPSANPAASIESRPLGLYVHVPFCATTCDFCAFYQTAPTAAGIRGYLEGIRTETQWVQPDRPVATIFWGGGTPGLLSPRDIRQLGGQVREFAGDQFSEWSVEMAPASVTTARLEALREVGVTRISLGVQSLNPTLLDALGRQHTREQVLRAYARVRSMDFASVNLDLMFALPGQTEAEWLADLAEAVQLAPDHLSTYCLTFEEDTTLWVKLSEGRVKLDPEHEARLYETTWEQLAAAGYAQYEVANFARPGHRCAHNLNTWNMHEWIGLGPSAASQYQGSRGANASDLERWQADLVAGRRASEDTIELTPSVLAQDALIFGLRLVEGVDPVTLARRFPCEHWSAARGVLHDLIADGLAERSGSRVRLTVKGRLLADAVGESVLTAMSGE